MSECYPTGCTPCTEPISFPESPVNDQRYCVDIGNDAKKCWVYDSCIPGWRAEGPSASPSVYRGAINIKTEKPGSNIEAGHFYIQTESVTALYQPEWGQAVNRVSPVIANSRIAFNGQEWQVVPGPEVNYASDALDGPVPSPDIRIGGIVKTATTGQAVDGTNKCDVITPYTLKAALDDFNVVIDIGNGELVFDTSNDIAFSYPDGDDDFSANKKDDTKVTAELTDTSVTPGEYINATITVDQKGRILEASNGVLAGALYLADHKDFSTWNGSDYDLRPGETAKKNGDTIINDEGTTDSPAVINPTLRNLIRNPQDIQGASNNQVYRGDMVVYLDPDDEYPGKAYLFLPRDLGVNLDYRASATNGVIENSAGADATIPLATETMAGLMSPGDKNIVNTGFNLLYDAFPDKGEIKRAVDDSVVVTIPPVDNVNAGLMTPDLLGKVDNDLEYLPSPTNGQIIDSVTKENIVTIPLVNNTNAGLMSPGEHIKLDALANLDALYLADVKDFSAWNGSKDDYNYRPDADPQGPLRGDVILNDTGDFAAGGATMSTGLKAKIFNTQDFRAGDEVVRGDKLIYVPDADNATDTAYWLFLPTEQLLPVIGNGRVTLEQNGVEQGSFTLNQENDVVIDLTQNVVGEGRITLNLGTGLVGTFNVNQQNDQTLTIPEPIAPGNGIITLTQDGNTIGTFTVNQTADQSINIPSPVIPPDSNLPTFAAIVRDGTVEYLRGIDRIETVGTGRYRAVFDATQAGTDVTNFILTGTCGRSPVDGDPDQDPNHAWFITGPLNVTENHFEFETSPNFTNPSFMENVWYNITAWRV